MRQNDRKLKMESFQDSGKKMFLGLNKLTKPENMKRKLLSGKLKRDLKGNNVQK